MGSYLVNLVCSWDPVRNRMEKLRAESARRQERIVQLEGELRLSASSLAQAQENEQHQFRALAWLSCISNDQRIAGLALERIGHQAAEPELFIKEGLLGLRKKHAREILLAPPDAVANQHFLKYWEPFFQIVRDPATCQALKKLCVGPELLLPRAHYVEALDQSAAFPAIHRLWGDRPPLLTLLPEDRAAGQKVLQEWGLRESDWFVGLHCREAGFINQPFHDFRNAAIKNFFPAIEDITARGGWVVRLGDSSMAPLPKMPRVIDYACSPAKSEQMDVFLCARSRFLLGTSSGLSMLASVFGVPCAITNNAPMGVTLLYAPRDIGIPKLVRSRREDRIWTFAEALSSPSSNYRFADQFEIDGLELVENSPEEILELSREMLERVEGRWAATPDDEELQKSFHSLFRPGHYTYGSLARCGRDFLRRHQNLL